MSLIRLARVFLSAISELLSSVSFLCSIDSPGKDFALVERPRTRGPTDLVIRLFFDTPMNKHAKPLLTELFSSPSATGSVPFLF